MNKQRIVIVGGALAGPTAAARSRECNEGAEIVMLVRGQRVSYAMCGLSNMLSGEVAQIEDLNNQDAEYFKRTYNIQVCTGVEVLALDAEKKSVRVRTPAGEEYLDYSSLIYAPGCTSLLPQGVPASCKNLCLFRTLDDLALILSRIHTGGKRVAIIGAGPIGLEAADGLARAGAQVHLIEKSSRLFPAFSEGVSLRLQAEVTRYATVHLSTTVKTFDCSGEDINALVLEDGERIPVDLVISAIGLKPRTDLFRAAGGSVASNGSILVDDRCRTSLPDVFACGICVSVPQGASESPLWAPQGALADKTAQVAGANAAGCEARLGPSLATMIVRCGSSHVAQTGLTLKAAQDVFGKECIVRSYYEGPACEPYIKNGGNLLLALVWNRRNGKVLGLEAIGNQGVDKRIDVGATAIAAGMDVEQLARIDFAYIPTVGRLRDPLNALATIAAAERREPGTALAPEDVPTLDPSVEILNLSALSPRQLPAKLRSARTLTLGELRSASLGIDRARAIVTICETGATSWLALRILKETGFANVRYLNGGLNILKAITNA